MNAFREVFVLFCSHNCTCLRFAVPILDRALVKSKLGEEMKVQSYVFLLAATFEWILLDRGKVFAISLESVSELNALQAEDLTDHAQKLEFSSLKSWRWPQFSHHEEDYLQSKVIHRFKGFQWLIDSVNDEMIQQVEFRNERRYISRHMVRMRDGKRLSTILVRPNLHDEKRRRAILARSPYGPTSDSLATLFMASNDLVAVIQDQRGTFLSEGEFEIWRQDGDDGYDTMEWIANQDWSNGEVVSAGISADACGAFTQILHGPKWLRGQFLLLGSANAHETLFPGGSFREGLVKGWMEAMSVFTRGKSLTKSLPEIMSHEALSDWYRTVEADAFYANVKWPTVHLTAWWDIFAGHQIKAFDGIRVKGPKGFEHTIFIGPLGHCALDVTKDRPLLAYHEGKAWTSAFSFASEVFAENFSGPMHSKARRINFFVQGPLFRDGNEDMKGNFWCSMDEWPEIENKKFLLNQEHEFVFRGSMEEDTEFIYTPESPVPTFGGNNLVLAMLGNGCGPEDQSFLEDRHDVLTFTVSDPLMEPIAVVGRVKAVLFVSSTREDTDFTVSVADVWPDGQEKRSLLVRYGIQRMRWRDGPMKPSPPMEPGQVYKIEIDLWPTAYVFNPGHRIRVYVSSSNSPYYSRNFNVDEDLIHSHGKENGASDATNSIHFSKTYPSHIVLPVANLVELEAHQSL